jgi:hypothetical protein
MTSWDRPRHQEDVREAYQQVALKRMVKALED